VKKTFSFKVPNKKPDRQIEAIRAEIKKYLARERRKPLKEGVDFWDFDCRIGLTEETAQIILETEIKPMINTYYEKNEDSFYVEILQKPGVKPPKKVSPSE